MCFSIRFFFLRLLEYLIFYYTLALYLFMFYPPLHYINTERSDTISDLCFLMRFLPHSVPSIFWIFHHSFFFSCVFSFLSIPLWSKSCSLTYLNAQSSQSHIWMLKAASHIFQFSKQSVTYLNAQRSQSHISMLKAASHISMLKEHWNAQQVFAINTSNVQYISFPSLVPALTCKS